MDFHGNINLLDNEMQQMVLQAELNFPEIPKVGRIVFKDKRVFICVELLSGVPAWVPLTNEIDSYVHVQPSTSATWTITHNLGTTTPLVQVFDAATQKMVIPEDIEVIDNNTVSVTFGTVMSGRAIVMFGSITGSEKQQFAYTHYQTNLSNTWVIPHNLGYYPIVRAFIGNEEVQPLSVIHDSIFQTTITFSSVQVGVAKLA